MRRSDVVVVGAGIAGCVAARELGAAGLDVVVLEARNRAGGRSWTVEHWDRALDIGGMHVHWMQPHVWAEVTRYGRKMYPVPALERGLLWTDGRVVDMPHAELGALIAEGFEAMYADCSSVFPRPYDPFFAEERVFELDGLSVGDRLDELEASGMRREIRDAVHAALSVVFSRPGNEGALTQGLRRGALAFGQPSLLPTVVSWRMEGGFQPLIQAIADDARADFVFDAPVQQIEQVDGRVRVTTRSEESYECAQAVVTAPLHALRGVTFSPPLNEGKQRFIAEGQMTRGFMAWVKLRGEYEPFVAVAPGTQPLYYMKWDQNHEGGALCQVFGRDAAETDWQDTATFQEMVRQWIPDAVVDEVVGHDWVRDEFTGEMWMMLGPGQFSALLRDLHAPEGRVRLAGSDYARGWAGYFDGAVESAIAAARDIKRELLQR